MTQTSKFAVSPTAELKHGPRAYIFQVGEMVTLDARGGYFRNISETFSVLAQLPPVGDDLQYRIKSANEPYQRVVAEHQLKRAQSAGG